jgi:hypothetical protein
MTEAGVLVALPKTEVKLWYQRQDSKFWRCCLEMYEEWRG